MEMSKECPNGHSSSIKTIHKKNSVFGKIIEYDVEVWVCDELLCGIEFGDLGQLKKIHNTIKDKYEEAIKSGK